jgi:tetratricopeptide (TPR) repeat protein
MELETSQKEYYFLLESRGGRSGDLGDFPGCTNFLSLVFSDFPAAESQFRHLTRNLPPIQEADWHDFQPKAAAWRALPVKPPLNAETDRHRILAENALKEKNLDSAIQHYEDALEIQPTWPAGWFNLALLYAEQKNYADATDSMKHYLELVPDAPDAQQAREQMIIWEDKAKH